MKLMKKAAVSLIAIQLTLTPLTSCLAGFTDTDVDAELRRHGLIGKINVKDFQDFAELLHRKTNQERNLAQLAGVLSHQLTQHQTLSAVYSVLFGIEYGSSRSTPAATSATATATAASTVAAVRRDAATVQEQLRNAEAAAARSDLSALRAAVPPLRETVGRLEGQLPSLFAQLEARDTVQARVAQLEVQLHDAQEARTVQTRAAEAAQRDVQARQARVAQLEVQLHDAQEAQERLDRALHDAQVTAREAQERLEAERHDVHVAAQRDVQARQARVTELEAVLEAVRRDAQARQARIDELERALHEAQRDARAAAPAAGPAPLDDVDDVALRAAQEQVAALEQQFRDAQERARELEGELEFERVEQERDAAALAEAQERVRELEGAHDERARVADEARARAAVLEDERDAALEAARVAQARVAELAAALRAAREHAAAPLDDDLRAAQEQVAALEGERDAALEVARDAQARAVDEVQALAAARDDLQARVDEVDAARHELARFVAVLGNERDAARNELAAERDAVQARIDALGVERDAACEHADALEEQLRAAQRELQARVVALEADLAGAQDWITVQRVDLRRLEGQVERLERIEAAARSVPRQLGELNDALQALRDQLDAPVAAPHDAAAAAAAPAVVPADQVQRVLDDAQGRILDLMAQLQPLATALAANTPDRRVAAAAAHDADEPARADAPRGARRGLGFGEAAAVDDADIVNDDDEIAGGDARDAAQAAELERMRVQFEQREADLQARFAEQQRVAADREAELERMREQLADQQRRAETEREELIAAQINARTRVAIAEERSRTLALISQKRDGVSGRGSKKDVATVILEAVRASAVYDPFARGHAATTSPQTPRQHNRR